MLIVAVLPNLGAFPMTDAPDPVTAGQPVTYTLMIRNNGARSAKGVRLTDDLPAGVTLGALTTTQTAGA